MTFEITAEFLDKFSEAAIRYERKIWSESALRAQAEAEWDRVCANYDRWCEKKKEEEAQC